MDDLDINIGMNFNMQLLVGESKRRHDVLVIGYLKGESLLVTMPRESGVLATIFPHDEYIVRYFKGRNIIAFKAKILHIATIPYNHLHLSFPTKLEKLEIRQAERIRISVPAQVLVEGAKHWAVLRDLSASGAQLVTNNVIGQKNEHLEVYFELKFGDIERKIHLVAMIRNVRNNQNELSGKLEYQYGVEFIDTSEHDAIFVQGFVYEQLLNNRDKESGHN